MKQLHTTFKHTYHFINIKKTWMFSLAALFTTFVFAQAPQAYAPSLGNAASFALFGGGGGATNQGQNTILHGSLGTTSVPTTVTGFTDGVTGIPYTTAAGANNGNVTGGIYSSSDAVSTAFASQTSLDINAAYLAISPASQPGGINPGAGQLGGLTLTPGVYQAVDFIITNVDLTLDAQGDPNAVWVFQSTASLTVGMPGAPRSVIMTNGGLARNVFWYVGSGAVINTGGGGVMSGTIISSAAITTSTAGSVIQTVVNGRILCLNAGVTIVNTTVNACDTWTGLTNNIWSTATNWSRGSVPVASEEVLIPNVFTPKPVVSSTTQSLFNLTIYTGSALTVTSTLQIGGFINNLGNAFDATNGTITMNGVGTRTRNGIVSQVLPPAFTNSNTVQNLIISNPTNVNLGGNINLSNLNLTNGLFNIAGNTVTINGITTRTNGAINGTNFGATVAFTGSIAQSIPSGSFNGDTIYNAVLNNNNGALINSNLVITNALTLTNGILTTGNNSVVIGNNASITGASATKYISGNVRKVGNQAFTFPIGMDGKYAPISISAPTNTTDHFTANYVASSANPTFPTTSLGAGLNKVSNTEYWLLNRTNGTSNVDVTLSFDGTRSGGITTLADLRVAGWNGTIWINQGNTATTGTTANGTVTSNAALSTFGPFTLGSSTASNALPVNIIFFITQQFNSNIALKWQTTNEVNASHFNVQRSADAVNFTTVGKVAAKGAGNYSFNDPAATSATSAVYYRLQMVDNDGSFTYSQTVAIKLNGNNTLPLAIYPNPVKATMFVQLSTIKADKLTLQVADINGKILLQHIAQVNTGNVSLSINVSALAKGSYVLLVKGDGIIQQKQFIKE